MTEGRPGGRSSLLNSYERLARGVNLGIYDDDVIKMGRRMAISKAYFSFAEMIANRRNEYGAPNAWIELEMLLTKWGSSDPTWLSKQLPISEQ